LVTGICPKCGKQGVQRIYRGDKDSPRLYLKYIHKIPSVFKLCHIGRVRNSAEAFKDFNESE